MTASDPRAGRATHRRWGAIALATLLAFLCQSFVTQTHLHVDLARSVAATGPTTAATTTTLKAGLPSPDLPDCPICREISHGGTYLPSAPVAIRAIEVHHVWRAAALARTPAPNQYSHAWRSRAPPRRLQA